MKNAYVTTGANDNKQPVEESSSDEDELDEIMKPQGQKSN